MTLAGVVKDDTIYFLSPGMKARFFSAHVEDSLLEPSYSINKMIVTKQVHSAYIHPSDSVLLFAAYSKEKKKKNRDIDLFIALKQDNYRWKETTDLNININTKHQEIYPSLSIDMKVLYFTRGASLSTNKKIFTTERIYETWRLWTVPKPITDNVKKLVHFEKVMIQGKTALFGSQLPRKPLLHFSTFQTVSDKLLNNQLSIPDRLNSTTGVNDTLGSRLAISQMLTILNSLESTIYFTKGSSSLNFENKAMIRAISREMKKYPDICVRIAGFADIDGNADFNLNLSQQRAKAVTRIFILAAIEPKNISIEGLGEFSVNTQLFDQESELSKASSRKVEMYFYDTKDRPD